MLLMSNAYSEVFLIKTSDRNLGIRSLLHHFDLSEFSGKQVTLKANFNSADPFPASTHLDTLQAIIDVLKETCVGGVTLAERSGMGNTKQVLKHMGVLALSQKLGFRTVVLDEVAKEDW